MCLLPQFQGAFIAMLLAVGWVWSGAVRLRELRRVQAAARSRVLRAAAAGGGGHANAAASAPQLPVPLPSLPPPSQQPGQLNRRGSHGSLAAQQHCTGGGSGGGADAPSAAAAAASMAAAAAAAAAHGREHHPAAWPAVTVVLPVKGRRAHSDEAWASQLAIRYGEPEFRVNPAPPNRKAAS